MFTLKRMGAALALLGLVGLGTAAAPQKAEAYWHGGGWCCGVHLGFGVPPVVVAPAYAPPPVYYAPPVAYGPQAAYGPPGAYYGPQHQWILPRAAPRRHGKPLR